MLAQQTSPQGHRVLRNPVLGPLYEWAQGPSLYGSQIPCVLVLRGRNLGEVQRPSLSYRVEVMYSGTGANCQLRMVC
jgi:hypothetical protein